MINDNNLSNLDWLIHAANHSEKDKFYYLDLELKRLLITSSPDENFIRIPQISTNFKINLVTKFLEENKAKLADNELKGVLNRLKNITKGAKLQIEIPSNKKIETIWNDNFYFPEMLSLINRFLREENVHIDELIRI